MDLGERVEWYVWDRRGAFASPASTAVLSGRSTVTSCVVVLFVVEWCTASVYRRDAFQVLMVGESGTKYVLPWDTM